MNSDAIITILVSATVGLIAYFLARAQTRQRIQTLENDLTASATAHAATKAATDARQEELRQSIIDARQREREAEAKSAEYEKRWTDVAAELKITLEQKGQFESEAARVAETKALVFDREGQIQLLSAQIVALERDKTKAVKDAEAANHLAKQMIDTERESHKVIMSGKDDQIRKLNEFITEARRVLTTEFKALSAEALKDVSAQLAATTDKLVEKHGENTATNVKLHQQKIETMLKPVEESLKRLDKHVGDSNAARQNAETLLDDQIKRLAGASESLTNALRKPVMRGSWGEMTLENALENAGLEGEVDFILQHYTDAEDGKKRTDAIVNLPKGRKLIIDSKNLMESYLALANSTEELEKAVLAESHSKALKNHIRSLSSKEYWRRYDGLDCVILFIPHDGMYHSAIRDEAELIRDACEKRVFISNPMSLIPLLKAVRYVLDQERLNKSAAEISSVGTELYIEVARFAESMAKIGNRLKSTVIAYNDAIPGLDRFIVAKSRMLKQLGSGKGADAELPEAIEVEPRLFSSRELRSSNFLLEGPTDPGEEPTNQIHNDN